MLDEQSAAEAVVQWAGELCGIPADRRFPYPQSAKTVELPDVATSVQRARTQKGADPDDFPLLAVENSWISLFVVDLSILVEVGTSDDEAVAEAAAAAAQAEVYGYAKALREGLNAELAVDPSDPLTRQLDPAQAQFASPIIEFDFTVPFVEYADGTRGRLTPATVRVAQGIPEPD